MLVADDQVELFIENGVLRGTAPLELRGKIEVRHLGICTLPYTQAADIKLVVELDQNQSIERMPPLDQTFEILGQSVTMIRLAPFEASAIHKLSLALKNT